MYQIIYLVNGERHQRIENANSVDEATRIVKAYKAEGYQAWYEPTVW